MEKLNIYISLTSIFQNQNILCKTLESILKQSLLPDKCYLVLSEESFLRDEGFKNKIITDIKLNNILLNEIFEIIWYKNIGPYRKLIPVLKNKWNDNCVIITLDDDTVYYEKLIENLVQDFNNNDRRKVISYRCHIINNKSWDNFSYNDRLNKKCLKLKFHTGKGSVLYYPKAFLKTNELIFREDLFMELCPTGDDIWFNLLRECNNIDVYNKKFNYMKNDNISLNGLFNNYNIKGNNIMIRNTAKYLCDNNFLYNSSNVNIILNKIKNNDTLSNNDIITIVKYKNLFSQYTNVYQIIGLNIFNLF